MLAALIAAHDEAKKATKYDGPIFPITAISGEGTKPLIYAIHEALEQMARPESPDDDELESEEENNTKA